jgi:endo-1,3-1,4-beta-glycanase ExoK
MKSFIKISCFATALLWPQLGSAVGSAELYSGKSYGYGRFEARVRFVPGNGVVSSFFLWKDGSEKAGTFWNELDFETLGADCHLQTNALFGNPGANHNQKHTLQPDPCGAFHTYTYEWTPEAIVWAVDGAEIRRDAGATPLAFVENASAGMQIHFNLWPGDSTFGGTLDPSILPVHEYVDWVQFSAYQDGAFTLSWREDFSAATVPEGWLTGTWPSPKNLSTHTPQNVNFIDGFAVLSLTADDALGPAGAMPGGANTAGSGGSSSVGGATGVSGAAAIGGAGLAGSSIVAGTGATTSGGPASPSTTSSDGGCSVGATRSKSVFLSAIGLWAMAFLHRRARRTAQRRATRD